jgi:hypothetical protein
MTMSIRRQGNHAARFRLTFRAWLYQHRNDADGDGADVGLVARILIADECLDWRATHHLSGYHFHLHSEHQASTRVLCALGETWRRYQREVHATIQRGV